MQCRWFDFVTNIKTSFADNRSFKKKREKENRLYKTCLNEISTAWFYLKECLLVLMSLFCSYITCKSYLYEYSKIQNNLPHFAISCSTARHFSLSQCASIASGSKSVRFFFNTIEHLCQWSCVFLLSSGCNLCQLPWIAYGSYNCQFSFLTKWTLLNFWI